MLRKQTSSPKIEQAIARSVDFELTLADMARRSEKRAWRITGAAVTLALILAGGYFYMLPLKEKVPYLVMADAYTGTSTVARLTDTQALGSITLSEAINRSNVAHYVLARESYDVAVMNLRDWVTVLTMSAAQVGDAYKAANSVNNPDSPYSRYGRDRAIRVKLLSTVLLGGGPDKAPTGATVRFQRSLYDKKTGATQPLDSQIATLEFTYKPNLKMDERYRIENPLGFQITSYRVDTDYATPPPPEVRSAAEPAATPSAAAGGESSDNLPPPEMAEPAPIAPAKSRASRR